MHMPVINFIALHSTGSDLGIINKTTHMTAEAH